MHQLTRRGRPFAPLMLLIVASMVACGPLQTTASSTPTASVSAPATTSLVPTAPASPQSTTTATSSTAPSSPTSTRSAEQTADALADALGRSDYTLLQTLITPSGPGPRGWFGGFYQSEGTSGMTPQETIDWLRVRTRAGSIEAAVAPRPIRSAVPGQEPGDAYILSTWKNFKGFATSNVELMLRNEAGTWYWSGALFNAPAR